MREAVALRCRCTLLWSIIQARVVQTKADAMKQKVFTKHNGRAIDSQIYSTSINDLVAEVNDKLSAF